MKFIKDIKITIGMAIAVLIQASGVIWYIAQLDSNVTSLQNTIQVQGGQINSLNAQLSQLNKDFNDSLHSEIDKLQEDQSYTKEKMSSIETKVSSLTDNGIKDDISFVKERVAYLEATSNDVIELDTTTAVNNFDPNDIGGFNSIMNPGAESHGKWWIQRFELPLGQNVITVEGAYVQTWGGTYQAGFGTEVIGPFDLTAFTSTTSYSALTIDVYTANTVFSTADIVDIEVSNNCNLSLPIVPYSIFGTLLIIRGVCGG